MLLLKQDATSSYTFNTSLLFFFFFFLVAQSRISLLDIIHVHIHEWNSCYTYKYLRRLLPDSKVRNFDVVQKKSCVQRHYHHIRTIFFGERYMHQIFFIALKCFFFTVPEKPYHKSKKMIALVIL